MTQGNDDFESQPIASLAELEQEVSPQFLNTIRKKIYRRTATNQIASFSWNLPKVILMEMLMLISQLFSNSSRDKAKL